MSRLSPSSSETKLHTIAHNPRPHRRDTFQNQRIESKSSILVAIMFAFRYITSLFTTPNDDQTPIATVTTTAASEETSATNLVSIKRENGFGDFCFDSVAMRNEKYEREKQKSSGKCQVVESSRPRGGVLRRQVMEDLIKYVSSLETPGSAYCQHD